MAIGFGLLAVGIAVAIWGRQAGMTDHSQQHVSDTEETAHPMTDSASVPMKVTSWDDIDDPASDGWDTEVFSRAASTQLESLAELLTDPAEIDTSRLLPLVTAAFTCQPLLPDDRATVFLDEAISVERAPADATQPGAPPPPEHRGAGGLATALATLRAPFLDAENLHCKFKLFEVHRSADSVTTRQHFSISGRVARGIVEQNATWSTRWTEGAAGEPPRLHWIEVEQFEQVGAKSPRGTLFSDCTESALSANDAYRAQICHGLNYWLGRSQDKRMTFGHSGLAAGDVDGDGLDDLYLCQESGLPNRLFIQNRDGTMRDASAAAGVDWLQDSRSALLVDLDNDGDQDLVVAIFGALVLAANDGTGKFASPMFLEVDSDTMSLSAVDYDSDGRLDLYVCVYDQGAMTGDSALGGVTAATGGFVYHDANNGGANRLFRNQIDAAGAWRFVDVTEESGLDVNNRRWSFAGAWEDFDNDGDQDLYVANDYGRNCLYRNDEGEDGARRFVDIAAAAGAEDSASGMSVTWADYDRDGQMDAYVSNMFSAAGNRITLQDQFTAGSPADVRERLQRFARGNTLLKNRGDGTFADTSEAAAVTMGRWAWGSKFIDINNDGWDDLVVANGYVTTDDPGDL
ncbi:MAG: hypothetical protein ACI9UA_005273 [Pseudoalteromonas tetraodonis]|jgi:hypothetical protein